MVKDLQFHLGMFSNLPLKVSGKLETDFSIPERRWIGRKDCSSLQLWTAKFTHLPPLPHHEFILLPIFLWLLLKCRKIRWSENNSLMKDIFQNTCLLSSSLWLTSYFSYGKIMIHSHILSGGLPKSHWNWGKQLFQFFVWFFLRHIWASWGCLQRKVVFSGK